jgi:hypothetical protein
VTNVTPQPAGPRGVTTPNPSARRNQIIILAVFVVVLVVLIRACAGGENRYEKVAHQLTDAVQKNDIDAVKKLENSETAADTNHSRVGHAADLFAPLGKIRRVKENTPPNDGQRVHEFDVTFEQGAAHEKILFDPDGKVFRWAYKITNRAK